MTSDHELLSRHLSEGDEAAFAELVDRYLPLVRGIAWRRTQRTDLVDDIAMEVFAALARKAPALRYRQSLAGWLTLATRMQAANTLRREDTRQRLMKTLANEYPETDDGTGSPWEDLVDHLDDALADLPARDREALMLRFYHDLPFREVGNHLDRGEDAARKRVNKAVQRMASFFRRRGIACSSPLLTAGLSARLAGNAAAQGTLSSAAVAKQALALNAAAPASLIPSLAMSLTAHKTLTTIVVAVALVLLSTGAGYLAGHQRGNAHRVALLEGVGETKPNSSTPLTLTGKLENDSRVSVKALIDQIATLSRESGQRPSARPEMKRLREAIPPHRFEEAFAIVLDDYGSDPDLQLTLMSYVLMEWAIHDPPSATRAAMGVAEYGRQEGLLALTLPEWGKSDPLGALEWVQDNGASLGSGAVLRLNASIFGGWTGKDPDRALDAFEKLAYDQQRQIMGRLWSAARDESVRESFVQRVGRIQEEHLRVEILERSIIEALDSEPQALEAAYDHLSLSDPGLRWRGLNAVADQLYGADPAATVKWIWERAPEPRRPDILSDWVAAGWALTDRAAAAAWLEEQGYVAEEWLRAEEVQP